MRGALLAAALLALPLSPAQPRAAGFDFFAIGDVPYTLPDDDIKFRGLIDVINFHRPAFTVHVGDIKGGNTPCTDEHFRMILARFQAFRHPLIYTPGDNEWTDCHRQNNGGYVPLERLETLRRIFFADPRRSLGRAPLKLESQAADPRHRKYVENARWALQGVVFATLHVVGSNNDLGRDPDATAEYRDRNAAVLDWMADAFSAAKRADGKAVVFFMQADPRFERRHGDRSGFTDLLAALQRLTLDFRRPVLLVHGDSHEFRVDKPLMNAFGQFQNFTRLEVFGAPHVHAVRVRVNPGEADPFTFQPIMLPGGG
jgi:hypothetical protein